MKIFNQLLRCAFARNRIIVWIAPAFLLAGCAGIDSTAVNDSKADEQARGFRYFDSSPYLLVQTDNLGGLTSAFMYLPDQTKKRQIKPYAFLASNATTLGFENGVLTNSVSDTDSSVVPAAIIKGLEQAALSAAKLAMMDQAHPSTTPRVYLFKVVKRNGAWGLLGAQGAAVDYEVKATK